MEKIYITTICQFQEKQMTDFTERYIIDENSIQQILSIYDSGYMIDIENGNQYPILKREKDGIRLVKNQIINFNQPYAVRFDEYSTQKGIFQMYWKAFKMRKNIKINQEMKSHQKVKK